MLLLGHIGITLGLTRLLEGRLRARSRADCDLAQRHTSSRQQANGRIESRGWAGLLTHIDYRLIVLGSMLPDIIDKPLGEYILFDVFRGGRIIGHTLLFAIAVCALAALFYRLRRRSWGLLVAFGSVVHLAFDEMWLNPATLFWPLLGWMFPASSKGAFLEMLFHVLFSNPRAYVPEIIGGGILAYYSYRLVKERNVLFFLRTGRLSRTGTAPEMVADAPLVDDQAAA